MIKKRFLSLCRTLHVYLTMFGLMVMLLFGVTGFTLNHEDWFGATAPRVKEAEGSIPADLLAKNDPLRLVEYLRTSFHVSGAMADYDDTPDLLAVAFKQPGETWEFEIEKPAGRFKLHTEIFNFAATLNDLHRGRDTGAIWRWVIDVCALLIVLACTTGIVLWLALPRRRILGIIALSLGVAGVSGIFYLLVPGRDAAVPAGDAAATGSRAGATAKNPSVKRQ